MKRESETYTYIEFYVESSDAYIRAYKTSFRIISIYGREKDHRHRGTSYIKYISHHDKCGCSMYLFDDLIICKDCNEIVDIYNNHK